MRMFEPSSPFHKGERIVQNRLGVRGIEVWASQVVRDYLPEQHREFHTNQPFLVVSGRDAQDRPWATLLTGPDGFVTSPDPRSLVIQARPVSGDALEQGFETGSDIGILGIELATRRRNRVNGRIAASEPEGLIFSVDQSFGNCPQYIRERAWWREEKPEPPRATQGTALSTAQRRWIENADTFFIASGYRAEGESPTFGMDVSHRGGDRGFVEVLSDRRLRFPDYAGNNHYNTIGNLYLDPRAGFLFVDFETGSLLQLTGRAEIDWDSEALEDFPGARRLITFEIDAIVEVTSAVDLRWDSEAQSVRSLRLVEKVAETPDVTSFTFESRDGGPLPPFTPGQHLPIEVSPPGLIGAASRTYSLSGAPGDARYRISVKREAKGLVSGYLHDELQEGAIVTSRRPAGDFTLVESDEPVALISAGVGITPMVSMLHLLAERGVKQPVWFIHGARDSVHYPLQAEVRHLIAQSENFHHHAAFSRPRAGDKLGVDYNSEGRVTGDLAYGLLGSPKARFYLCGPGAFMAQVHAALERKGVSPDRIHYESFGASL